MPVFRRQRLAAFVLAALVAAVPVAAPGAAAPRPSPDEETLKARLRAAIPAAVLLLRMGSDVYGRRAQLSGTGSGILVHPDGYVLTSFHLLGSTDDGVILYRLYAFLVDPSRPYDPPRSVAYRLRVVKTSYRLDLALLKVDGMVENRVFKPVPKGFRFPAALLGDSDKLEPTDRHWALGYPAVARTEKLLSGITVLAGQVIGLDRAGGWIKSDAGISPGNSGGPVVDAAGRVIGVSAAVKVDRVTQGRLSLIRAINLGRHLAKGTPAWARFPAGPDLKPDVRRDGSDDRDDTRDDDGGRDGGRDESRPAD